MTRAEMLTRLDSAELSAWLVLLRVQADEQAEAAQHQKDLAESGDGIVQEYGRPDDRDDDETEGD